MSELRGVIEKAYEMAKSGHWDRLMSDWETSDVLANRCSRYSDSDSSWTFLHQAAYFGNEQACRELIRRGAPLDALTRESRKPADVAEQQGYRELEEILRNASIDSDLWEPPVDPDVLPSSNRWGEATPAQAHTQLFVGYGGGVVSIPKCTPYFTDSLGRVLVGWHGTFNPPSGMDGGSMLSRDF